MNSLPFIYPRQVQARLQTLRDAVFRVASQHADVGNVTETIKWGEPAYLCPRGSTVRLGWSPAAPERCALHFHCQTTLVETFRELYGDHLVLEGSRAMVFGLEEAIPMNIVEHCLYLALTYHRRKHLPLLGMEKVS